MELSMVFCIFFCFSVLSVDNRLLRNYFQEPHLRFLSQISLAPSPEPEDHLSISTTSSSNSVRIFNVLSYGAVGDSVTDDTQAFNKAWNNACQTDSGILFVPNHHSFMIQSTIFAGPCKGGLVFQIEGTIMPPDGPDSWPKNLSKRQWLVFKRVNGMSMQGGGLIDGRGEKWWNLPCKPHKGGGDAPCDSPAAIRFFGSSSLTLQGLMVRNSPQFHITFDRCHDVNVDSLYITSPSLSPNTDGIHLDSTSDVKIHNSIITNGDDCISIGPGCHNLDIKNKTCGPSHGISIGSLGKQNTKACVSNITVTDSFIKHSDNGVRIKTWQGGFGSVSKVTFNNIFMDTVRNPINIDQYYCDKKGCKNQTAAVYIFDILYTDIKGTYDIRSPPMQLACSESVPCTNLTLSDIKLSPAQGQKILDPYCYNAYGALKTITVPTVSCLLEGHPPDSLPSNDVAQC